MTDSPLSAEELESLFKHSASWRASPRDKKIVATIQLLTTALEEERAKVAELAGLITRIMPETAYCPDDGAFQKIDEDGCCTACGMDTNPILMSEALEQFLSDAARAHIERDGAIEESLWVLWNELGKVISDHLGTDFFENLQRLAPDSNQIALANDGDPRLTSSTSRG